MNQINVGSPKWIGVGLGPVKTYCDSSYNDDEGIMYNPHNDNTWKRASNATKNSPQYSHFNVNEYELDMLLDFEGKAWSLCMVGRNDENHTKKFTNLNLPGKGLVPHFNMYHQNLTVRIAKIPPSMFGVEKKGIFGSG